MKKKDKVAKKSGRFSYYIGNALILFSLISLTYLLSPLVSIYLFPPQIKNVHTLPPKGEYITIPKIHAQAPIILNVDPWNETIYRAALKKGVAHAKGTALPGEPGMTFLFAHSSGPPWETTRYNTIFLRLGELARGDKIIITANRHEYVYRVHDKKIVFPTDVQYLLQHTKNELVLQTCTPIGTSYQRLLIFAQLLNT